MLFLSSQSGNGFTLIVVFMFDVAMNAMGVQEFFALRMSQSIVESYGLTKAIGTSIALGFSFFASSALGLSIMQATINNRKATGIILSFFSIVMTSFGLLKFSIVVADWRELLSFDNIAIIAIIISITFIAPIVYAMNAGLFMSKGSKIMERFNEASTKELEKSFNAQVKDLGDLDAMKIQKEVNKQKTKYKAPVDELDFYKFDN